MKVHTRKGGLAAAIVATATLLGACSGNPTPTGGSPSSPTAGAPTVSSTPAAVNSADPARVNADLVIWCDNDRAPVVQKYAAQFAAENGITAAVQVATDVRSQFSTATKVGKGPDVIVGAHDWLGEFVQNDAVQPVSLGADVEAKFSKTAMEAAKFNGQTYGVPYAVENIALVRNTNLAPNAPTTMDELVTTGQDLVKQGKAKEVLIQEVSKTGNPYYAYPYLAAFGGGIFGKDAKGNYDPNQIILNSPESIKGAQVLADLGKQGILSTNVSGDNSDALFDDGTAPYFITGPWAIDKAKKAGIPYAISNLPSLSGGAMEPFVGVQMFYVSSKAKNATLAQEFVTNFVTRKDVQLDLYKVGHRPPALTEAYQEAATTDPDLKAWFEAGKDGAPMPNIPAMASVWTPMGQAEADVISGAADPKARFDAAAQEIAGNIAKGQ